MKQYRFWWDELNIEHIANHGVEPYEVVYGIKSNNRLRVITARDLTSAEKKRLKQRK